MPNNRLKLCMLSGSFEYDSETSLAVFQDYIEKNHPVQATQIIYQSEDDDQSLEPLEDTDVLLVFTRRLNTTGDELDRFKAYCAAGRPIVGVRTASHAYENWLDFDEEVLGGDYQGHYGAGPIAHAEIRSERKRPSRPTRHLKLRLLRQPLQESLHCNRYHTATNGKNGRTHGTGGMDAQPSRWMRLLHFARTSERF